MFLSLGSHSQAGVQRWHSKARCNARGETISRLRVNSQTAWVIGKKLEGKIQLGVRFDTRSETLLAHSPTCLVEFSNYAELCTFEYAWSNAEEVRRISLDMSGLLIVK